MSMWFTKFAKLSLKVVCRMDYNENKLETPKMAWVGLSVIHQRVENNLN